jgi:hypothetical protein
LTAENNDFVAFFRVGFLNIYHGHIHANITDDRTIFSINPNVAAAVTQTSAKSIGVT